MSLLRDQWNAISRPQICVIGDLILDRYLWTTADRISPEAPVMVLRSGHEEERLGGAASVALLLRSLECNVSLIGITGNDAEGRRIQELADDVGIDSSAIRSATDRPTTLKTRILGRTPSRQPHQILRIDRESQAPIGKADESQLAESLSEMMKDASAVLVSDYGKGVCTPELLRMVFEQARLHDIPVAVDPAKSVPFDRYSGAPLVTPNRNEARAASGRAISCNEDAVAAGQDLCRRWGGAVVLKLDRDGLLVLKPGGSPHFVRSTPRDVCDVTGAGDMILAVLGLCLGCGWNLDDAAGLANVAAGLEVERVGVTPVSRKEIADALDQSTLRASHRKIVSADVAGDLAQRYRNGGQRVVFTNGCFDLLHAGHIHCLEQSAARGDILFVAINDDTTVRRLKGQTRPIIPQEQRLAQVAALECVDHVVLMDRDTPHHLLEVIRPDVLVKGKPYTSEQVVGAEVVWAYGGEVEIAEQIPGLSTTSLTQRISINEFQTRNAP